jgi:GxxExxY protein
MGTDIRKVKRDDLLYPDLSYKILGILFEAWGEIGYGHKEKIYQRAVAVAFKKAGLSFEEELPVKLSFRGERIGMYYFDFLVQGKIILELKVRNYFSRKDIEQLYSYLKAKNLKLGIIAHFTKDGVKYKRVVNIKQVRS